MCARHQCWSISGVLARDAQADVGWVAGLAAHRVMVGDSAIVGQGQSGASLARPDRHLRADPGIGAPAGARDWLATRFTVGRCRSQMTLTATGNRTPTTTEQKTRTSVSHMRKTRQGQSADDVRDRLLLQAAPAGRTGVARHERRPWAAAPLPLPRGPHPRPRPAVLAHPSAARASGGSSRPGPPGGSGGGRSINPACRGAVRMRPKWPKLRAQDSVNMSELATTGRARHRQGRLLVALRVAAVVAGDRQFDASHLGLRVPRKSRQSTLSTAHVRSTLRVADRPTGIHLTRRGALAARRSRSLRRITPSRPGRRVARSPGRRCRFWTSAGAWLPVIQVVIIRGRRTGAAPGGRRHRCPCGV